MGIRGARPSRSTGVPAFRLDSRYRVQRPKRLALVMQRSRQLHIARVTLLALSDLASSVPPDGDVVTTPVSEITFTFDNPVEPFVDGYTLTTFEGADLPMNTVTKVDEVTIIAIPAKPIREVVTAQWAIVSGDSHPITGSIVVAVDLPPPPSTTTTAPPQEGPALIAVPSLIVHVATISVWAGGLLLLLVSLRRPDADRRLFVGRFSRLAGLAILVTALTGVVMAILALDSVSDLWDSAYGQRLLIKVALVASVGVIGALHRFVTIPRMQAHENDSTLRSFVRLGWVEIVLFAAVLGATAWLILAG
jgi:methionine-rich copper-binding protein CopC